METTKNSLRLLVLVPHRDARLPLRAWSASLFAAGMPGAWSFPWAVPLAQLKRPLSGGELKSLALAMRQQIDGKGGKLVLGPPAVSTIPVGPCGGKELIVFGPVLSDEPGDGFFTPIAEAVERRISPLVLGSALVHSVLPNGLPSPLQMSFRAAALANMEYSLLSAGTGDGSGYSCEWKIGKLCWLPKRGI